MMTAIRSYAQLGRQLLRKWAVEPRIHTALRLLRPLLSGFLLSAASLGQFAQPLTVGLVTVSGGWSAALSAVGGSLGYWLFWGKAGLQGILWMVAGLVTALTLGSRPMAKTSRVLLPTVAALNTAAAGLLFQLQLGDTTPVPIYLLRVAMAAGASSLFLAKEQKRGQLTASLLWSIWVLALAQIPLRWMNPGMALASALAVTAPFPTVALAGLALDLGQVMPVPITAVLCLTYFLRSLPGLRKWMAGLLPVAIFPGVMALCGSWNPACLPPLALGGLLGRFLPNEETEPIRRGETGIAQVRLELAANVFSQMQQLLLEQTVPPIDEEALILRAADRACGSCPGRKGCKERAAAGQLSPQLLHRPLLEGSDLGIPCKKDNRLLQELRRGQEQLRSIRASRELQREYRSALVQQYQFFGEYLQDLSDDLGRRTKSAKPHYRVQVSLCANRPEADNGDRCQSFSVGLCCHYILLCDGMGTGSGAIEEARTAGSALKKLLTAGFPPEYALRSLNSLCALRGFAGAVTVDLAQLQLDTGKVLLYKWGAAPSYLLSRTGTEKIGTAGPPPGLSTQFRETVDRLSLRRGEMLIMCSDGAGGEDALRCAFWDPGEQPGELAARILESRSPQGDDATVAVVRLIPDPRIGY